MLARLPSDRTCHKHSRAGGGPSHHPSGIRSYVPCAEEPSLQGKLNNFIGSQDSVDTSYQIRLTHHLVYALGAGANQNRLFDLMRNCRWKGPYVRNSPSGENHGTSMPHVYYVPVRGTLYPIGTTENSRSPHAGRMFWEAEWPRVPVRRSFVALHDCS